MIILSCCIVVVVITLYTKMGVIAFFICKSGEFLESTRFLRKIGL